MGRDILDYIRQKDPIVDKWPRRCDYQRIDLRLVTLTERKVTEIIFWSFFRGAGRRFSCRESPPGFLAKQASKPMCGRFVLMTPGISLAEHFRLAEEPSLEPR